MFSRHWSIACCKFTGAGGCWLQHCEYLSILLFISKSLDTEMYVPCVVSTRCNKHDEHPSSHYVCAHSSVYFLEYHGLASQDNLGAAAPRLSQSILAGSYKHPVNMNYSGMCVCHSKRHVRIPAGSYKRPVNMNYSGMCVCHSKRHARIFRNQILQRTAIIQCTERANYDISEFVLTDMSVWSPL